MKFIKYDSINMEFKLFRSEVDYEYKFNNLEEEIVKDLTYLTDFYHERLLEELVDMVTINILMPVTKKIDDIPVKIYFFAVEDYKALLGANQINTKLKMGINVCLYLKDHYMVDISETLQTVYFNRCDISDEDMFKNYIYNLLFYTHIIVNEFCYHPLLRNLYHEEDIENFIEIKSTHIRLFGDFETCSVCMENTTCMTKCKHMLCQKCACTLDKKICPICRRSIMIDVQYYLELT
jgi:hypothetical protein